MLGLSFVRCLVRVAVLLLCLVSVPLAKAKDEKRYEPLCDTTREIRDDIREQMIHRVVGSGAFKTVYRGTIRRVSDADPQGESLGYQFPRPVGGLIPLVYQMPSATDAMVYLYCNPAPPGPAYWGTTAYLVSFSYYGLIGLFTGGLDPNAEMGDSLNQYRLSSTAGPDRLPWGHTSAIITTPDVSSAAVIQSGLEAAGLPPQAINVQVVPSLMSQRIEFGTALSSSVFVTGFRYRAWGDRREAEAYADYEEPVIYLTGSSLSSAPFGTPPRLRRGGKSDQDAMRAPMQSVIRSAQETAAQKGFSFVGQSSMKRMAIMDPENCLFAFDEQPERTCLMGSQDISYGTVDPPLSEEGMHLVVGVIHAKTDHAEYSSVGFPGDNVNTLDLMGTAELWAPDVSSPDREGLYVLQVSHNCPPEEEGRSARACLVYPEAGGPYIERVVLEKRTRTGPAFEDLESAVVLQFDRRK